MHALVYMLCYTVTAYHIMWLAEASLHNSVFEEISIEIKKKKYVIYAPWSKAQIEITNWPINLPIDDE